MENYSERYNLKPAAAWLRGHALKTGTPEIDPELLEMPLEVLTDEELSAIVEVGEKARQKLYPFKTGKAELPRVRQVMGFLHGIEFETLLDVGSGRGGIPASLYGGISPGAGDFPGPAGQTGDVSE